MGSSVDGQRSGQVCRPIDSADEHWAKQKTAVWLAGAAVIGSATLWLLAAVLLSSLGGCAAPKTSTTTQPLQVWQDPQRPMVDLATLAATPPATLPAARLIDKADVVPPAPSEPTTTTTAPATLPMGEMPEEMPPNAPEAPTADEGRKATLIYPCRYARPETLAEVVAGLLTPEGNVLASPALNRLVVMDKRATVVGVQKVLEEVDQPTDQLLIEARVVEIALDSDLEYEIEHVLTVPPGDNSFFQSSSLDFKTPGGSPTDQQGANLHLRTWSSDGKTLDNLIRLLVTRSKAKILSSPNLVVSPGNEASIITGQEVPVQSATVVSGSVSTTTLFKRVGIKLRVGLQQVTNDTARVEISPEVSTITGFTNPSKEGVSNPIIAIRNVSSTLTLKDGEILTVGGLLQTEDRQIVRGVPLLSDIPVLGLLFQSRRNQAVRTQLIFFLRAHILPPGAVGQERLHKPAEGMQHLDRKMGLDLPPGNGAYPISAEDAANVGKGK